MTSTTENIEKIKNVYEKKIVKKGKSTFEAK